MHGYWFGIVHYSLLVSAEGTKAQGHNSFLLRMYPDYRLLHCENDGVLGCTENISLSCVPIFFSLFLVPVLSVSFPVSISSSLFFTFWSFIVSVSGLLLRSLTSLELSFMKANEYIRICTLLHATIQFDEHQLLMMLPFLNNIFFYPLCKKSSVHMYVEPQVCQFFNLIPLINMPVIFMRIEFFNFFTLLLQFHNII